MAAATIDRYVQQAGGSFCEVYETRLSALTSDQLENVLHKGPASVAAGLVVPVTVEWVKASDSTSNNTVGIRARVGAGGDIAGATISVFVFFFNRATAGLNPPT